MREILHANTEAINILGEQKLPAKATVLKKTQFLYSYEYESHWVHFNIMTRQCISDSELLDGESDGKRYIWDQNNREMNWLVKNRFLVPETTDEEKLYIDLINIIRLATPVKPGFTGYMILPTTACNARCFYCYEKGIKIESMTREMEEETIEFIKNTHSEDTLKIRWFGGEPMVGRATIEHITAELNKAGISYRSMFTSNASLFTEELVRHAVSEWHMYAIQVTLDGTEYIYNDRKDYLNKELHNFKTVIRNIHYMADNGVKVTIRINFNRDNLEDTYKLINYLAEEYPDKSNIDIYPHHLFDLPLEECRYLLIERRKIIERINRLGFGHPVMVIPEILPHGHCMADNPTRKIVIGPHGNLGYCDRFVHDSQAGTLAAPDLKYRTERCLVPYTVNTKCKGCAFLPQCVNFCCPSVGDECALELEEDLMDALSSYL